MAWCACCAGDGPVSMAATFGVKSSEWASSKMRSEKVSSGLARFFATRENEPVTLRALEAGAGGDCLFHSVAAIAEIEWAPQDASGLIEWRNLDVVSWDTVMSLAHDGALVVRPDEFGEMTLARREENMRYISVQKAGSPQQFCTEDLYSLSSKFDRVLALMRKGWRNTPTPDPHRPGSAKEFLLSRMKPTSYFCCLAKSLQLSCSRPREMQPTIR